MQRPIRQSLLVFQCLFGCLLFVGLPLASCSNPSEGSTTTASPANSMTLKVAMVTNGLPFFPFYVAMQQGMFKQQGLTFDPAAPTLTNSGAKLATAVESDSVEVGVGGLTDVFTISRVDAYIKIIGDIADDFLIDIVVSKQFEQQAHLNANSTLSEKVQALKGKKIGISAPGSATDALVTYLFRQEGLDSQKDAVKVNVGASMSPVIAALQAGRIDAAAITSPGGQLAETKGIANLWISPTRGDIPTMRQQLFSVAYVKQKVIDAKPKAIAAFIRGLANAEDFMQKHPEQMEGLLAKYLSLDPKTANNAWAATKVSVPLNPLVSQQPYDTANQFHVKAGLIALPLDYKELVATDTINKALSSSSGS
jgi:NitT/TauT family transport system substrate-binding protein